jgi:hypothetical protein
MRDFQKLHEVVSEHKSEEDSDGENKSQNTGVLDN